MTEKTRLAEHKSLSNTTYEETREIESRVGKQRTSRIGLREKGSIKKKVRTMKSDQFISTSLV